MHLTLEIYELTDKSDYVSKGWPSKHIIWFAHLAAQMTKYNAQAEGQDLWSKYLLCIRNQETLGMIFTIFNTVISDKGICMDLARASIIW